MLNGTINKIGLVLGFLSACCWVVYVVGFGLRYQHLDVDETNSTETVLSISYFMYWSYAISSMPLYLAVMAQFMFSNLLLSLTVAGLTPLALTAVGGVLNINGLLIFNYYITGAVTVLEDYVVVEFAGASTALLLLWITLLFWIAGVHRNKINNEYETIN